MLQNAQDVRFFFLIKELGSSSCWYLIWVIFPIPLLQCLPPFFQPPPDRSQHCRTQYISVLFFLTSVVTSFPLETTFPRPLCLIQILPFLQKSLPWGPCHFLSFLIHFGSYLYCWVGPYLFYLPCWIFRLLEVFIF